MMQSGYQSSTLFLIATLAVVGLSRENQIQEFWQTLAAQGGPSGQLATSGKNIGIAVIGVIVIVFISGLSDTAGKMMIALSVGLWLLFLMNKARVPIAIVGSPLHKSA